MRNRLKYVLSNEEGASNVEIVVWISVILIIIAFFFIFHDNIVNFLKKGFNAMDRKHHIGKYISQTE